MLTNINHSLIVHKCHFVFKLETNLECSIKSLVFLGAHDYYSVQRRKVAGVKLKQSQSGGDTTRRFGFLTFTFFFLLLRRRLLCLRRQSRNCPRLKAKVCRLLCRSAEFVVMVLKSRKLRSCLMTTTAERRISKTLSRDAQKISLFLANSVF